MKRIFFLYWLAVLFMGVPCKAQFMYGTTGLLHAPTADMQRDKTFMFGASFINHNVAPGAWNFRSNPYHTLNYYLNVTIFPWVEVEYNLVLNQGTPGNYWRSKPGASLSTRTVPSTGGCGCGRKAGGRNGHRKSCSGRTTLPHTTHTEVAA